MVQNRLVFCTRSFALDTLIYIFLKEDEQRSYISGADLLFLFVGSATPAFCFAYEKRSTSCGQAAVVTPGMPTTRMTHVVASTRMT